MSCASVPTWQDECLKNADIDFLSGYSHMGRLNYFTVHKLVEESQRKEQQRGRDVLFDIFH